VNTTGKGLLEKILDIIARSEDPSDALNHIVTAIKEAFGVDVCSVYSLFPGQLELVLRATEGLSKTSIGAITMKKTEGLTGLVLETMKPVFVVNPASHPRYKYYRESGEEIYKTFLGLPLVYHKRTIGVMVIQTINDHAISEKDIPFFTKLATQVASTVAYTGILENLKNKSSETPDALKEKELPRNFLKGVSGGSGFAMGNAFFFKESMAFDQIVNREAADPDHEVRRFEAAVMKSAQDIHDVMEKTPELTREERAVIEAHLMYLNDRSFKSKVVAHIYQGDCAEFALKQEVLSLLRFFEALEDPYLRERGSDIEDIGKRVLGHLLGQGGQAAQLFGSPTILFARDLSPVDLIHLNQENLKGIVLAKGGITSHMVILAKSFEIPIIIGVKGLLQVISENDEVIMDAVSGIVFKNPPDEIRHEYERMAASQSDRLKRLDALKEKPAVTQDGHHVQMGANIGLLSDMAGVQKHGADFIGLYRTEFPFLIRKSFPTEEEQFELYQKMVESAQGKIVTIRTFDLGGDKVLSNIDYEKETNPFLGWRSVRFSLDSLSIFREQLRAILRASFFGSVRVLFPMITTVKELIQITGLIEEEKRGLREAAIPFDETIQTGVMVEVPAAALILDKLLNHADFVSIGTNDLVQYLLAVDRNNEKVAHLYHPLHPAVIHSVRHIIEICRKRQKPVCICGEAATDPNCVALFVGMGASCLSMSATAIPQVKHFIRQLRKSDMERLLTNALSLDTNEEISSLLTAELEKFTHEGDSPVETLS
jgi:phosphotransferase system enzyme I (PtsP)